MFTELLGRLRALVSIDRRRSEKIDQFANRSEKNGGIIVEIATANAELDRINDLGQRLPSKYKALFSSSGRGGSEKQYLDRIIIRTDKAKGIVESLTGLSTELAAYSKTSDVDIDRAATKTAVAIKGLQKIRKTLEAEHADILGYNDWTELTNTDWDAK